MLTRLTCCAVIVVSALLSSVSAAYSHEFPAASVTYQINTLHDGFIQADGLRPPLHIVWSVNLGPGLGGVSAYPVIVGGMVYVSAGQSLVALNARTGRIIWTQPIPTGSIAWIGPAYDNGRIFAATELAFNPSPALFSFDAKNGRKLWSAVLPGQYVFSSPPAALNGVVYTGGAGSGGTVYAARESDGKILWTQPVMNGDNSSPVVTSSSIYVSYACPQTYNFTISGMLVWQYSGPCEGGGGTTPVLHDGLLYVGYSFINYPTYDHAIFNATTGQLVGQYRTGLLLSIPAFSRDLEFVVKGSNPASLVAVDPATGRARWQAQLSSAYESAPIVVQHSGRGNRSTVFVPTVDGRLLAYDARNGELEDSVHIPPTSPAAGSLGAADDLLVVPTQANLVALSGH